MLGFFKIQHSKPTGLVGFFPAFLPTICWVSRISSVGSQFFDELGEPIEGVGRLPVVVDGLPRNPKEPTNWDGAKTLQIMGHSPNMVDI